MENQVMNKEITLKSNCIATIIPAGEEVTLAEGATFTIAQSLGNSVTLRDSNGMYRVGEDQLSALGDDVKQVLQADQAEEAEGPFEEKQVWDAMRGCYDPEIPVNIVDLGLIYDLRIDEGTKGKQVFVKMTLTAQGCGMGPVIADDAKTRIEKLSSVESAEVEIVWEPQWNPRMISEEGKKVLGLE